VRTAGVRPESLHVVADGARGAGLAATVAHVENLGHETLVHADVASVRLVTRVPGMSALRPGDRVTLAVDARAVHFFDERGVALRA
jgi:ABC-type sugar transport system ATPase subunit